MNSRNKLYEIEATPPAGAWNHISKELDEWNQHKTLSKKLDAAEIPPPTLLWNKIETHLNETKQEQALSNKLYHLQAEVPTVVWSNIIREMDDEQALSIVKNKISNLQMRPPAILWRNMQGALNGGKESPQKPIVPTHYGWLKYAAAACFIAVIGLSVLFIFNDESNSSGNSNSVATTATSAPTAIVQNTQTSPPEALPQPKRTFGNPEQKVLASIETHMGNAYTVSNEKNTALKNRYIILMTQDGNVVRMSKKVSSWADCVAGEDHSCDDQISKWQKEMAGSETLASPDIFLDILDMAGDKTTTESGM